MVRRRSELRLRSAPALRLEPSLSRAILAAGRRYLRRPGVVGVAVGYKFRGGKPVEAPALQFLVKRKLLDPARPLPRTILAGEPGGRPRRRRVLTDVIPVGRPCLACASGSRLRAPGERGTITLIFRDRGPEARGDVYLLTCAHVAGDLERTVPLSPDLRADCRPQASPFARVLKCSVARQGVLEHDLAAARLCEEALPVPDLERTGGGRVEGWLDPDEVALGLWLEVCAASGRRRGQVVSLAAEVQVLLRGRRCLVRNLVGLAAHAADGDSGALVHRRGEAAGVVVARSDGGLLWWQPLEPALEHLNRLEPRTALSPFATRARGASRAGPSRRGTRLSRTAAPLPGRVRP